MARKDKPYLPLYVQDFMTDEKLMECSASATGVYIRIMCVMHKSDTYGTILLKQKDKQSDNQVLNFATKLAKHLPYDLAVIVAGIEELLTEQCLNIDGDLLIQKRMMEDGKLSETRSRSGSSGGKATQNKKKEPDDFAKAKLKANKEANLKANSDIEIDNENDIENENEYREKKEGVGEKGETTKTALIPQMHLIWKNTFPMYTSSRELDYPALKAIADFIFENAKVYGYGDQEAEIKALNTFQMVADEVKKDAFWINKPLSSISKNIQEFYNKLKNPINGKQSRSNGQKLDDSKLKEALARKRQEWG